MITLRGSGAFCIASSLADDVCTPSASIMNSRYSVEVCKKEHFSFFSLTPFRSTNWLQDIRLDWKSLGVAKIQSGSLIYSLTGLSRDHKELFEEGQGTIKGFKARLAMEENAKPKFCCPRPVPFALKEPIEQELHHLKQAKVIEKVPNSE